MLASLLPGLRDLRTPLAAGYVWLVALWVALEPLIPNDPEQGSLLGSLARAGSSLSVAALGVAISFAAYLFGILSTSLLSRHVRRLGNRDGLSDSAREGLEQVAREGRERLDLALALSNTDIGGFFEARFSPPPAREGRSRLGLLFRRLFPGQRRRDTDLRQYEAPGKIMGVPVLGPGNEPPERDEVRRERLLAGVIRRDLGVVATTRLLGRDQELYGVVDKNRAEAEFRLGLMPPLVALAVAVAARSEAPWAVLAVAAGLLVAYALLVDAVASERRANEVLVTSMVDGRVTAPSLERAEQRAATISGRTRQQELSEAAIDLSLQLEGLVGALEDAYRSEPAKATAALAMLPRVREALTRVRENIPGEPSEYAEGAVVALTEIAEEWNRRMSGQLDETVDLEKQQAVARDLVAKFRGTVARVIADFGEAVGTSGRTAADQSAR